MIKLWKCRLSIMMVMVIMILQVCSNSVLATESGSLIGNNSMLVNDSILDDNTLIDEALSTTTPSVIGIIEKQPGNLNGEIHDVNDLKALVNAKSGEVYSLTQDIDLSGESWTAINFNATLDGKGHRITLDGEPLFYTIGENAVVKNFLLEGSVSSQQDIGALAYMSKGTIYNNYSSASVKQSGFMNSSGGLIGKLEGGSISNCFVTGNVTGLLPGGSIAGSRTDGTISDSYWVGSMTFVTELGDYDGENCSKKSEDEAKKQAFSDLLNKNLNGEDIRWGFDLQKSNYPILGTTGQAPLDKTLLIEKIDEAKQYNNQNNTYTEKTWQILQKALDEAKYVADDNNATQIKVDESIKALDKAIKGLLKVVVDPLPPTNKDEIILITTKDQLMTMEDGKYYQLQEDIVLDNNWYNFTTLNAVLDGNGFKIIMDNSGNPVFDIIGEKGVVKNLGIQGSMSGGVVGSTLAVTNKGSIINSYATASIKADGKQVLGGLVEILDGGAIYNAYVSGSLEGLGSITKGGLVGTFKSGSITNAYWLEGITASQAIGRIADDAPEPDLETTSRKGEIKSDAFIALLNANKGNSMAWGYDAKEDAIVIGGKDQLPENGEGEVSPYTITYTSVDGVTTTHAEDGKMKLFTTEKGSFKLEGYDGEIDWVDDPEPYNAKQMLWINNNGSIHSIDGEGRTKVGAYSKEHTLLAECTVATILPEVSELQIWLDGVNVTNGKATVKGSEAKVLKVKAKLKETDQFVDVGYGFVEVIANSNSVYIMQNSFEFNKPTTEKITVTAPNGLSAFVEVTSEYVPITSIKPTWEGNYKLHARNPNSEGGGNFLPIIRGVIVEPSNASYKNDYTVTSSHPEVAEYIGSMVVGVVPYKVGTTTFTATANDGDTTGSSTMHFEYQEPLQSVATNQVDLSVSVNEDKPLDLVFTSVKGSTAKNEESAVTEPELIWTYEGDGKVNIYRKQLSHWVEGGGLALASQDYTLTGIKEGKVKAIGTPVDQTNGAKPIVLNITVTEGKETEDIQTLIKKGMDSAKHYLQSSQGDRKYMYGSEWPLFTLTRSGERISQDKINGYEASVVEIYSDKLSGTEKKPTTIARVALTLDVVNKRATNAQGINFIEMLYNHSNLNGTSNDLMFALIAIDACQYEIPQDAKWTRERIIEGILAYQNPSGGFGLGDNQSASVDMTAMALQALSNDTHKPEVQGAVERGLDYLRSKMDTITAGFDGNVESVAQVLTALTALGIDPIDEANGFVTEDHKNIITNLMMFYDEVKGGFSHTLSGQIDEMSTVQGLYALEAYQRFINNENKLYDLTDINIRNLLKEEISYAEKIRPDDYTEESFKALQNSIRQAQVVLNNPLASDEMIQEQTHQLRRAIEALEWKALEKKLLIDQLDQIKQLVASDYTVESWETLQKVVQLAGDLLEDKSATEEDFKKYLEILLNAIENLKRIEGPGGIKEKVTVSIDAKTIGKGYFVDGQVVEVSQGDTVVDALKEVIGELNLRIMGSGANLYVASMRLGGEWLGEFDYGPKSGWMYGVNGHFPDYSAGNYELSGGDQIEWQYTIDLGNDLGKDIVPVKPPIKGEPLYVEIEGHKDDEGVAKIELSDEALQHLIDDIEMAKNKENASLQMAVNIPKESKGMTVTLPENIVSALAQAKDMKLVISSDYANITLDAKTIKHVMTQSKNKKVRIELIEVPTDEQSIEIKIATEDRKVYGFNIIAGKDSIMDFGGEVTVCIPYKMREDEKAFNILFYHLNEKGTLSVTKNAQYHDEEQIIIFQTNTPKSYIMSYAKTLFDDVEGWSQPYVYALVNKDIIQGKDNNLFEPKAHMTRAEFITLLARVSGEDLSGYDTSIFEDVKENAWYKQAIIWASEKGIAKGYDGKFNPNHDVTRQDIAVMLERYMEYIVQKEISSIQEAVVFIDEKQIAPYAKEAVYKMQQANMIEGNENRAFLPQNNVTREEVAKIIAVMLQRINE